MRRVLHRQPVSRHQAVKMSVSSVDKEHIRAGAWDGGHLRGNEYPGKE
jgi:hypothetical protein